jgi:hypothetical protein
MTFIQNAYYTILPKMTTDFRKFVYKRQNNIINKPVSITPIGIMIIILASIIAIVATIIRLVTFRLGDETFSFFTQINVPVVNERI